MAHWLRVLVLTEDPDSGSSTHMGFTSDPTLSSDICR